MPTLVLGRSPPLTLNLSFACWALRTLTKVSLPLLWQTQPVAVLPSLSRYLIWMNVLLPLVLELVMYTQASFTTLSMIVALVEADSRTRTRVCVWP